MPGHERGPVLRPELHLPGVPLVPGGAVGVYGPQVAPGGSYRSEPFYPDAFAPYTAPDSYPAPPALRPHPHGGSALARDHPERDPAASGGYGGFEDGYY